MRAGRDWRILEFAFSLCLIGVFSAVLLGRLLDYQELAEKARMESVVLNLRSALRMRMGEMMMHSRAHRWSDLLVENPFEWLDPKPANYCGQVDRPEAIPPGCWAYQSSSRHLIYRVNQASHFQGGYQPGPVLRFVLKARISAKNSDPHADTENEKAASADTIELVLLEPYRWY